MLGNGGSEGFWTRRGTGSAFGLDDFHVNGLNRLAQSQQGLVKLSLLQPHTCGPGG